MQSESTIESILSHLKTDLQETIDGGGEYWRSIKKVERGFTKWEDTDRKRPFVWFEPVSSSFEEISGGEVDGELLVEVQGYIDRRTSDPAAVHKLLKDLQYYFYNDFSHASVQKVYIDAAGYDEGDRYDELGRSGVALELRILFSFEINTI